MAAYRKIPATGDANLDLVQERIAEAFAGIPGAPAAFQAVTTAKDYAATGSEGVIHVDASAGPVRVTLPKPSATMAPLLVKQVNQSKSPRATFGAVTVVAANAAATIAGSNSFALDASGTGSVTFTSDGQQHWPGAAAGGNPSVTPTPPAPPPFVPPPSVTFVPLTRNINTVPPLFGGGQLSADLTLSLQQSGSTLLGNPNAAAGNTVEITLGTNLSFGVGGVLNAAGGSVSLPLDQLAYGTGAGLTSSAVLGFNPTNTTLAVGIAPASADPNVQLDLELNNNGVGGFLFTKNINAGGAAQTGFLFQTGNGGFGTAPYMALSMLGPGYSPTGQYDHGAAGFSHNSTGFTGNLFFQESTNNIVFTTGTAVSGGTTRMTITQAGAIQMPTALGAGGIVKATVTTGQLGPATAGTDYTVSVAGTAPISVGGAAGVRTVSLVTDSTLTTVIGNLGVVGVNDGSGVPWVTSGAWASGKILALSGGNIVAIAAAAAITWPAITDVLVSSGTGTAPVGDSTFTFDTTGHTLSAGNGMQLNASALPSNVSLAVGISGNANRDRAILVVGGGTLGPTGSGDSTLVDISPASTSLNTKNVTGGIYATQRIRAISYTGGNLVDTVNIAASLYIDAAPTLVVVHGTPWGVYVAGGGMHVTGAFECTTTSSAAQLVALGTGGTVFSANGNGTPAIGVFGASGGPQQTGGAASAGATYTATEQGMINRMYSALRTYGWLT